MHEQSAAIFDGQLSSLNFGLHQYGKRAELRTRPPKGVNGLHSKTLSFPGTASETGRDPGKDDSGRSPNGKQVHSRHLHPSQAMPELCGRRKGEAQICTARFVAGGAWGGSAELLHVGRSDAAATRTHLSGLSVAEAA